LIWTAGFLAFPVAGLAGAAVAGRVHTPVAALLGGAVTGLVIGAGQALASSRRLDPRRWVPATGIGMGLGLLLGATTVGYRTSLADLALMGALTGLVLGAAQAAALPHHTHRRWIWTAALPVLWALGWTATTLGGIAVDQQFTVFGAVRPRRPDRGTHRPHRSLDQHPPAGHCIHSPGSATHGRNTRRCPARSRAFTSATVRRVVRSPPVKPIATSPWCTTSARTRPLDRATSSSILSRYSSIGRARCSRATTGSPATRSATYRATVWWSHPASSAAAR
jgi:hypothetical protein